MRKPRVPSLLSCFGFVVILFSAFPAGSQTSASEDAVIAQTPVDGAKDLAKLTAAIGPLEKMGTQVLSDRPWLTDLYSWNETFDLTQQQVKPRDTGAYCVGNGKAFALIGLSSPLWSWSNLYGASYQEPDLGTLRMNISRAGNSVWMPKQQIGWVRRSGIVKVRAEGSGLAAESYDFAPVTSSPEESSWNNPAALVRVVHLTNTGKDVENDLDIELKIQSAWNVRMRQKTEGHDLLIDQKAARAKKRTVWRLAAFNPRNVRIWDNNLHYAVPRLKPGDETWVAFFLLSANSSAENGALAVDLRENGALHLLDQTRDYFQKWFEKGTSFAGDPKVTDLFDIESIIFKCQQSHTGGFSPLIGYSYTWIRDNNGPIRWFLKTGHPQEAKRAMDFFYGVGSSMGSLPNSIRVDYPLNYHLKDLSGIHVEHAETPNWIVLQHWWYYLSTGDLEFIRSRWGYLKRCLTGQVNVEDKYFFHRDETYLWCIESRCFEHMGFPNYDLSTYAFATDSSFDIVAAADRLAYLGSYLEMDRDVSYFKKLATRVRNKAEETYWNEKAGYWAPAQSLLGPLYNAPHANILVNPFWCGYARNDLDPLGETPSTSKRAVDSIRNAYPWLGREDGFWKTTPGMEYFVGMNPGQLLVALCKARLPWAEKAYRAVFKTATPSGEFAEMYDGEYHPWNPPSWGVGTSGRVRPWEGGLNTESILEFLTGFAPDAGHNRLVLAPHLPEDMKEFTANRLFIGDTQISLQMKRASTKVWVLNLHLDKGTPISVVMDFWASHRTLGNIEASGAATWDKSAAETNGRQARCHFVLENGKDVSFTVAEDSRLPEAELNPPKPQEYQPEPYRVSNSNLLLITSPSGVFYKRRHTSPENFLSVAKGELKTMEKATSLVSFLDIDLPIAPSDIAEGMIDEKGNLKTRLVVFGRGVFCAGKHHFKPVSYWTDPKLAQTVKKFLNQGGCLFFGPSFPNREVLPDWFISLTGGGWEEGTLADKAVLAEPGKIQSSQKLMDEVDVANEGSETGHAVTFTGEILEDTQKLPDGLNEKKMIEDNGRVFNGYYQFTVKTAPGIKHRLWLRVNTGRNIKGMALQIQRDGQWSQVGVRTQNDGATRHFQALYFDIPENWITSEQTVFRLLSKTEPEVNAYHLWMYKVEGRNNQSLPELLGFVTNRDAGEVNHGLIPKGKEWKMPFLLSQHPEQGAVLIQKIGKGYLIRSELSLENSVGMLRALLSQESLNQMGQSW